MLQSDDDIPPLSPGIHIAVSLGDLLERVAPINDRFEFSRLSQLRRGNTKPAGRLAPRVVSPAEAGTHTSQVFIR